MEKRVAVIAVHGVGHAEAGSTVRHIADLLLGLGRFRLPARKLTPEERARKEPNPDPVPWGPEGDPPYSGFHTQPIQIPLKAAPLSGREKAIQRTVDVVAKGAGGAAPAAEDTTRTRKGAEPTAWQNFLFYLDERRGYVAEVFASKQPPADLDEKLKDHAFLGHEFMRAQLAGYLSEQDGKSYDTIRLETEVPEGDKKCTVHLYEAYWADLARPQNSIFSFFLAFYQLLLHLGSLSRTAVDYATLEHYKYRSWRWHAFWQGWAVRFLVLPIILLNLYLLLAGLSGLPLILPWNRCYLAAFGMASLALGALLKWPGIANAPTAPLEWIGLLFGAFSAGGLVGYWLTTLGHPEVVLAIEWWLLGFGLLYALVLVPYDRVRRGAARIGILLYVLSLLAFIYCLVQAICRHSSNPVDQAGFWTMQILMFALILSWLGLLFSALAAYFLHYACLSVLKKTDDATRVRARAALRTGRLTLAASSSLILIVTLFLWSGIYKTTRERLHLHGEVQVVQVPLARPLAAILSWVVPTTNDTIRWAHQPKKPAPSDDDRIKLLEHWDWDTTTACQPRIPTPPPSKIDEDSRLRQLEAIAKIPSDATIPPVLDRIYRLELYARLARLDQWNWQDLPACRASAQPSVLVWPPPPSRPGLLPPRVPQPYENEIKNRIAALEQKVAEESAASQECEQLPKKDASDKDCPRIPRIGLSEADHWPNWAAPLDTESRLYRLELLAQPNSEPALDTYADALLLVTATAGLPWLLLLGFAPALVLLAWAVVPCLLVDTYSLTEPTKFNNRISRWLGNWYSRGLDSTRNITWLLWHSIFTMTVIFGALDFAYSHGWLNPDLPLANECWLRSALGHLMYASTGDALHILSVVGGWLAVSGVVIGTYLYQKGRVVLDIILDVDHYLRTSPLNNAPRARIAERYTSLLRYIASEKDQDGQPYYTSVVIAAHSLGALISADLMQYLARECPKAPDPALRPLGFGPAATNSDGTNKTPIPIHLFTFGNPLRQLMSRFFPHLYWWVRKQPDNALHPLPNAVDQLPAIPDDATPEPKKHNLTQWVSAYRSGDFVGRSLWLDGWFARTCEEGQKVKPVEGAYGGPGTLAVAESPDKSRVEFCIGPGGHNNYWDRSAPDIAHILDAIIRSS